MGVRNNYAMQFRETSISLATAYRLASTSLYHSRPVHITSTFDAGNAVLESISNDVINLRITPDPYCGVCSDNQILRSSLPMHPVRIDVSVMH